MRKFDSILLKSGGMHIQQPRKGEVGYFSVSEDVKVVSQYTKGHSEALIHLQKQGTAAIYASGPARAMASETSHADLVDGLNDLIGYLGKDEAEKIPIIAQFMKDPDSLRSKKARKEYRRWAGSFRRKLHNKIVEDEENAAKIEQSRQDIIAWVDSEIVITRAHNSKIVDFMHHLKRSYLTPVGTVNEGWFDKSVSVADRWRQYFKEHRPHFQDFLIQTDWAKAFRGAEDYDTGSVALPVDECAFEMVISGKHIIALAHNSSIEGLAFVVSSFIELEHGWMCIGSAGWLIDGTMDSGDHGASLSPKFSLIMDEVRAVCIALDANVVESTTVEPNRSVNKHRVREGKLPLRAHHVVNLTAKHRRTERNELDPDRHVVRRRLHFRRGHWRHFQHTNGQERYEDSDGKIRSRTRIPWMLVGDADLGWIDKEYRI